jgi:hypothetical protein
MTITAPLRRQPVGSRRTGYLVAAAINVLLVYAAYAWPGWREVPFLTEDTPRVLWLVALSLLLTAAFNVLYVAYDPPRLVAFGSLVCAAVALVATVRIWQVFPFEFATSFDWALVVRTVLVVAIAGTAISMIVQLRKLATG